MANSLLFHARALRILLTGVALLAARPAPADDQPRTAGPYVPTPQVIVDRMLQMARVGASDFVVDLGSGDGRMVRTAARVYGASGFGVDIDGELVELSNAEARREGIAARAKFYQQDIFTADIRKATVVTLYVLPGMMTSLLPKVLSELKPGTRIVSHDYYFQDWVPDSRVSFDVPEKKDAVGFSSTSLYLWVVPAHVGGRWRLEVSGAKVPDPVMLSFQQTFQYVNGVAQVGTRKSEMGNIKLKGDAFEFGLDAGPKAGGDRYTYRGKVKGDTMEGEVAWGTGVAPKRYKWKATRLDSQKDPFAR
ncbi:MAG: class I SAM-dependent methyltransferase [Betaproteobacteria bacterium]|nr:MAG: class I SAM-dependent methyltransferase [Betaproteobacteria bacterium]